MQLCSKITKLEKTCNIRTKKPSVKYKTVKDIVSGLSINGRLSIFTETTPEVDRNKIKKSSKVQNFKDMFLNQIN